ncbi:wax ester/triacylglycerol synthase family O-acyltransferase [Nocardia stercoris]|uniref:Diacylglycerol O-acyltransferase n=1 Tax=Nocardia stercoris TaxID=2483361 RepID=A0A3M2L7B6_9NOCA|nr:wax ester/triacylglycerol synthase family O-acyltransferase [Nocardia stercoris]RMI33541.1 wax ester/triacylglycerol synthase family O-acyltransferase [Nocardia stercoris]
MTVIHALDTGFLALEDADPRLSLGIGAVAIIAGRPPDRDRFASTLAARVDRMPRLRDRLSTTWLELRAPTWEPDPRFDVAHHIRWTALPAPADLPQLYELVAADIAERLDRDHPLWQCTVVERVGADSWAVIVKAHHVLLDGISGIELFDALSDRAPAPAAPPQPPARRASVLRMLELPLRIPRAVWSSAQTLLPVLYAAAAPGGRTSLSGPVGHARRYAVARTTMSRVRGIAARFDVTVNDVAVAAVAGAYRAALLARHEDPGANPIRVVIPISTRTADAPALGNQVSAMLPELPVDRSSAIRRLRAVHERIAAHRGRGEAAAEQNLLGLADRLPYPLVAWAFRMASRYPQHRIAALATNVPGPAGPLTFQGGEVREILPYIPLGMRLRTTIAILSYAGHLVFGVTGDFDTAPDVERIAAAIEAEIAELDRLHDRSDETTS